jgi:hypothetical protein
MEPWIYQRSGIRCLGEEEAKHGPQDIPEVWDQVSRRGGNQTWTHGYTRGLGSGVGEEEAKHGPQDIPED